MFVVVEVEKRNKVIRRSFDYGRLRMLDSRLVDETLEKDEVNAIAAHLFANYSQFQEKNTAGEGISEVKLKELLEKCPVMELDPNKPTTSARYVSGEPLYTRGEKTAHCTVILRGRVKIQAGREGMLCQKQEILFVY